jgi:hypothetical protein
LTHSGSIRKNRIEGRGSIRAQIELKGDEITIPFRANNAAPTGPQYDGGRVVDVLELAKRLHAALIKKDGMKGPLASFTSAEFAVQMTDSPGRVQIKVGNQP